MEMKDGAAAAAADVEASEEESLLMEGMAVLDFDMLCSTVAMQAHKGKWGKLNDDNEEENLVSDYQNGGGVFRMWEGEIIYDCFDDRLVALQSTCCPCYRFGKNMKRAGFGSCFLQGSIHFILAVAALSNLLAFIFTRRRCFLYLAILFTVSVGTYIGFFRTLIRKKFNIKVRPHSILKFPCLYIAKRSSVSEPGLLQRAKPKTFTLKHGHIDNVQESRTLEMNNVEDGIWHGRGDTICIGTVSTKSPECLGMQKDSNDS